jgi:hypothetical protein
VGKNQTRGPPGGGDLRPGRSEGESAPADREMFIACLRNPGPTAHVCPLASANDWFSAKSGPPASPAKNSAMPSSTQRSRSHPARRRAESPGMRAAAGHAGQHELAPDRRLRTRGQTGCLTVVTTAATGRALPRPGQGVVSAPAVRPGIRWRCCQSCCQRRGLIPAGCAYGRLYSWIAHMFPSGSSKKQ